MNKMSVVVVSFLFLACVKAAELSLSADASIHAADYTGQELVITGESAGAVLTVNGALNLTAFSCAGLPFTLKIAQPVTAGQIDLNTTLTIDSTGFFASMTTPQTFTLLSGATIKESGASVALVPAEGFYAVPEISESGVVAHARQSLVGARAISVNFLRAEASTLAGQLGTVGFYEVNAARWMNITGMGNLGGFPEQTVAEAVTDSTGETVAGASIQVCSAGNSWYNGGTTSLINKLMYSYFNDNNSSATAPGSNYVGFQVTGVPYDKYAVIVYYNTDKGAGVFASPCINGGFYCGGSLAITRAVGDSLNYWGAPSVSAFTEGGNLLVVTGFTKAEHPNALVYTPPGLPGGKRTTMCGFQIVEIPDQAPIDYTATLPAGDAAFSQIQWDDSKIFRNALTDSATITFEGDATLTLDSALTLSKLTLTCPGTLTILSGLDHNVMTWDLSGVDTVIVNSAIGTYTPPATTQPRRWLYTNPAGATLTTQAGARFELMGGESARIPYTVTYKGGTLCMTNGLYTYTAPGSSTQTTLEIGDTANISMGATGTGNFALGKMDATISGGTITAGRLIAPQGVGSSPTTILQTGGDITLSAMQENFAGNEQPFLLGNYDASSPSRYILQGGSIDTGLGALHLGFLSKADLEISGGRLNTIGILGSTAPTRTLTLTGGELSIGYYGIRPLTQATFTLGGGELTASAATVETCFIRLAPTTLGGTTTTLSATTGKTLEFLTPIDGTGNLRIGSSGREGTVALSGGTTGEINPRYIRFTVADWPKGGNGLSNENTGLAIAEILLTSNGTALPWTAGTTISSIPAGSQSNWLAENIIDGNYTSTYYCYSGIPANGKIVIEIDRGTAADRAAFNGYQIFAASQDGRNPLTWVLEGSNGSALWFPIDSRTITAAEVKGWNNTGATATAPASQQARTFMLTPTLTVTPGAILGGTGAIGHAITFETGSKLAKLGQSEEKFTTLSPITLPTENKIGIIPPAEENSNASVKYYLISAPYLTLTAFTVPDRWGIGLDEGGLFLRKRSGTMITLY